MDLETENRIASILLREAAELRREAEKEGALAYLGKPNVRARPNSRFLTATVLGVQQANRVVEVNEMWRVRQKEHDLDDKFKRNPRNEGNHKKQNDICKGPRSTTDLRHALPYKNANNSSLSINRVLEYNDSRDDGLKDEEVDNFLHSRVKRGRGAVGSRMDEAGPYLPPCSNSVEDLPTSHDIRGCHVTYGPDKPFSLKSYESSDDEEVEKKTKKARKVLRTGRSNENHKRRHKSKKESKEKKNKHKKEKRHHE